MKKKILIIEDDQFLRDFYMELLSAEGYQIDVAGDGDTAFAKIKQGGWDLIMLDIMLPKKDGIQILKDLKDQNINPSGPILVLTNLVVEVKLNWYGVNIKSKYFCLSPIKATIPLPSYKIPGIVAKNLWIICSISIVSKII